MCKLVWPYILIRTLKSITMDCAHLSQLSLQLHSLDANASVFSDSETGKVKVWMP